jgi:dihydropteroate synthase
MARAQLAGLSVGDDSPVVIMGVINLAPETFYKGSLVRGPEDAAKRAEEMVSEGADIIDLGAMSTAPGVGSIPADEERKRLLPVLEMVGKTTSVPVSVDTQRATIAKASLEAGAQVINDVSGFKADPEMAGIVSDFKCSAILMATKQKPGDARSIEEVQRALRGSLEICEHRGVDLERIVIDPGIGFGKRVEWDLHLLANLRKVTDLGRPVCVAVSRKSFIGRTLELEKPVDRLWGSLSATAIAVLNGTSVVRTHDPKETLHAVRVTEAIQRAGGE